MTQQFQAIYEGGLLRPLEPLALLERQIVTVTVEARAAETSKPEGDAAAAIQRQQQAWKKYVERMEALPDNSPRDGFSNRDHDCLTYGELR